MSKRGAATAIAFAAVALGVALTGCGSDSKTDATTSTATSASTTTTSKAAPTTSAEAAGPHYTISDYIKDNAIVETEVHRGDPGSPTIDMPIPPGWEEASAKAPEWAYSAVAYSDPAVADNPPMIITIVSKLTGNVDPEKILEFAPGSLKNMPGYEALTDGTRSTLGGFDAYQLGGTYIDGGIKRVMAHTTVVIPKQGGLYVLQLAANGLEDQMQPLREATTVIDEQTTITP